MNEVRRLETILLCVVSERVSEGDYDCVFMDALNYAEIQCLREFVAHGLDG